MEIATTKPLKSSLNISDIVSKFAKVCKLRSVGVFASENPFQLQNTCDDNGVEVNESSDATEDTKCECEKIYPQLVELPDKSDVHDNAEIEKLFDIVSALKSAYARLQKAHIPHSPKMIIAADKLVMAELEALYKVKRTYKEKHFTKSKSKSSQFVLLQAKIKANETLLGELKSRVKGQNSEVIRLANELKDLDDGNVKLGEKMKRVMFERKFENDLNIDTFQQAFAATSMSIHNFAKPLISLMKASGWNLDLAVKSIEGEAVFLKRSHKKYAFEAYITRRMFSGLSLGAYDLDHVMRFDDPIDALIEDPDSDFAKFCGKKYLMVVHQAMEVSFFGNLDHRKLVLIGKHPRTPFYQIFARMARWVWVLQGIADSLYPKAKPFIVNRRSHFSDVYMESAQDKKEGGISGVQEKSTGIVEFMIMPGYKIGDALVKSRVYIS